MFSEFDAVVVGYLIDPAAATMTPVKISKDHFDSIVCSLVGCELIESIPLDRWHLAHCDSRRMMEPVTGLWNFPARTNKPPIAGKAVITGVEGKVAPTLSIQSFAAMITAFRPVIIPDAAALVRFASIGAMEKFGTTGAPHLSVEGFHLEIERRPLAVQTTSLFDRRAARYLSCRVQKD